MIDKEQLKKMIKSQEEAIKKLTEQLNDLKGVARENGVLEEPSVPADFSNSSKISSEVEKKRQEIFNSIQKVREEAQAVAKKAMEDAKNNISSSLNLMSNLPKENIKQSFPNVPLTSDLYDLSPIDIFKERNVRKTDNKAQEKMKKVMEEFEEKKRNRLKGVTSPVIEAPADVVEEVPSVVVETHEVVTETPEVAVATPEEVK